MAADESDAQLLQQLGPYYAEPNESSAQSSAQAPPIVDTSPQQVQEPPPPPQQATYGTDDGDASLPMFSTLIFSLGSIFVTLIILVYTVFEFRSTADFIIRVSNGGSAQIQQIANTIVNQAKSIVNSTIPEIEQSAENVVTSIIGGLTTTVNTFTSVGGALLGIITDTFGEIADLIRDYGLQTTQLLLNTLLPVIQQIGVALQAILDVFQVGSAFWQALVSIIQNIINVIGPLI